jgi:hypothetical protein
LACAHGTTSAALSRRISDNGGCTDCTEPIRSAASSCSTEWLQTPTARVFPSSRSASMVAP